MLYFRVPSLAFYVFSILFLMSLTLTFLNIHSLSYLPDRHSSTIHSNQKKAGISLQAPEKVLAQLKNIDDLRNENDVSKLTNIFSSGVMNYWPNPKTWDQEVIYDWQENWIIALISRIENEFLNLDIISTPKFMRAERFNYESIIAKGVGYCSQVSIGVSDFVTQLGFSAEVIGLDGHVVSSIQLDNSQAQYVVDADYGVYIPHSIEKIEREPELIRKHYAAAGYNQATVDNLVKIYGFEGNQRYSNYRLKYASMFLNWLIPFLFLLPAYIAYRNFKQRNKLAFSSDGEIG